MSEYFLIIAICAAVFGAIGAVIDGPKGFVWGALLGPLGLVLAAILKRGNPQPTGSETVVRSTPMKAPTKVPTDGADKWDAQRWAVLKEVDVEIKSAALELVALNPSLEVEFAKKYLILNDKQYVQNLKESIVRDYSERMTAQNERIQLLGSDTAEQLKRYEESLAPGRVDTRFNGTVDKIEPYEGSWRGWHGGLAVHFNDGRVLLINKNWTRLFPKGDLSWQ